MATVTKYLQACDFSAWCNGGEYYATMSSDRKLKGQFGGAGLNLTQYKITAIGIYGDYRRNTTYIYPMGNTNRGATLYNGSSISSMGSAISSQSDGDSKMSKNYAGFTNYYTTDTNIINSLINQINSGLVVTIDLYADNNKDNSDYRIYGKNIRLVVTYEAKPTYALTVQSNNTSYGTVSGGGTYYSGTTATLTATPKSGYKFASWNDGNTSATRTVTVTGNSTYTATFEKIRYNVSIDANGGEWTVGGNPSAYLVSNVAYGDRLTIGSTGLNCPRINLEFLGWKTGELLLKEKPLIGYEDLGEIVLADGTKYTTEMFDAPYYANTYRDLYDAFGYDKYALAQHYHSNGSKEGRQCTSTSGVRGAYLVGYTACNLTTEDGYTVPLRCQWGSVSVVAPSLEGDQREGYEFVGWTDGTNTYKVGDVITVNEGKIFNALWKETKPEIKSIQMIYLDKQISETNKVPCGEGFIISVELN